MATGDRLKLVVVVSRHGVRPPTWSEERLNRYSAIPWPQWPVAPGYLTQHGFDLVEQFGRYDRAEFVQEGLLAAEGCGDAAAVTIRADTDERTMESGRALATGLFPECAPEVHSLVAGERDPLFSPDDGGGKAGTSDAALAAAMERVTNRPAEAELLAEMQRVLSGCDLRAACKPAHAPEVQLLDGASDAHGGQGDPMAEARGSLPQASSFAEDFLLEYAEGMPLSSVGWGRLNEAQVRRLIELHTVYFNLRYRTPALARAQGSAMLWLIATTLQQGAEGRAVEGAIGKPGDKLVVLMGHDTNLANVAALLGLHWNLDGRRDDTPPGMEMAFALWQTRGGKYVVRLSVTTQTLDQMRMSLPLNVEGPPARQALRMSGCPVEDEGCGWEAFQRLVQTAVGPDQGAGSGALRTGN